MLPSQVQVVIIPWGDVPPHPQCGYREMMFQVWVQDASCRRNSHVLVSFQDAGSWEGGGYASALESRFPACICSAPALPTAGLLGTGHAAAAAVMQACAAAPWCVCAACQPPRRRHWMTARAHSHAHRS